MHNPHVKWHCMVLYVTQIFLQCAKQWFLSAIEWKNKPKCHLIISGDNILFLFLLSPCRLEVLEDEVWTPQITCMCACVFVFVPVYLYVYLCIYMCTCLLLVHVYVILEKQLLCVWRRWQTSTYTWMCSHT